MGQYWKIVNLDKREYIHPHKFDCGLKLLEQIGAGPGGTGDALLLLCAAMPVRRGGQVLKRALAS